MAHGNSGEQPHANAETSAQANPGTKSRKVLIRAQLFILLSVIGPGLITAIVDNDTGGITTYSIAGAQFGYALLWLLIPILLVLIIIQEMSARMGVVTGKGFSDLIRERFGLRVTFYTMLVLIIVNFANVISEFAGIAAGGEIFGISKFILVPLCSVLIWFIIVKGSYKSVERVFMVICIFYVAYVISGLMAKPDWGVIFHETVNPHLSFSTAYIMLVVGLIGTTIAPWMQFYLQSSIVEKGIKIEEYKYSKLDVIVGSFGTVIIALFIIIATAATIFKSGQGAMIKDAADAAIALAPLAGQYATYLFAFGLFNAGLFSAAILPLSTSYSVCEGLGWETGVNKKLREAPQFYTIFTALIVFGAGVILLIPNKFLIMVMYLSQVLNGVLLPVILIMMLILINNKKIMGKHVNSPVMNVVGWGVSGILIVLSTCMIVLTVWPGLR
ncbi:MAG: Nramp family divalent metal transporter [Nanoarchaeota archaeon]